MPLNTYLRDLAGGEEIAWRKDPNNPKREISSVMHDVMAHSAMQLELGELTERNVDEWLYRIRMVRLIGMELCPRRVDEKTGDLVDVPITREDLEPWFGFSCNVCTETRRKWHEKFVRLARASAGVEKIPDKTDDPRCWCCSKYEDEVEGDLIKCKTYGTEEQEYVCDDCHEDEDDED